MSPYIVNLIAIAGSFVLFAVVHSLVAGSGLKSWLAGRINSRLTNGLYRVAYNGFAALTLLPTLVFVATLPDVVLYQVRFPWALLLIAVQLVGVGGVAFSLLNTNLLRFVGVEQVADLIRGGEVTSDHVELSITGAYRYTRHPLYWFSLLFLWGSPILTYNTLLFNIVATLYLFVGSRVEEKRLEKAFGEMYRAYQQEVPWFLPWPRKQMSNTGEEQS